MKFKQLGFWLLPVFVVILAGVYFFDSGFFNFNNTTQAGSSPRIKIRSINNRYGQGAVIPMSTASEPSINVSADNTNDDLHINVYRASIDNVLEFLVHDEKNNQLNKEVDVDALEFVASFDQDRSVETRVLLPIDGYGIWYVNVRSGELSEGAFVVRSGYGVLVKEGDDDNIFWGQNFDTKKSVSSGDLKIYNLRDSIVELQSLTFDDEGISRADKVSEADVGVFNIEGQEGIVFLNLSYLNSNYRYERFSESTLNVKYFLFTDRPLYKPGDTVNFKSILRQDHDAVYSVPSGQVNIEVYSGYGNSRNVVFEKKYYVSGNGSIDGNFVLPEDIKTGYYKMSVELENTPTNAYGRYWGNSASVASFNVEYYQKPEYSLEIESDGVEYLAQDNMFFDIKANYFSGHPINGQELKYNIKTGRYYSSDIYAYYQRSVDRLSSRYNFWGKDQVAHGVANINDGLAQVEFQASTSTNGESKVYIIEANFTDETGRPAIARKNVLVHAGEYGIYREKWGGSSIVGETKHINIILGPNGDYNVANVPLKVNIHRKTWVRGEKQERQDKNGNYYYHYGSRMEEEDLEEFEITTNSEGMANLSFVPSQRGSYSIKVSGQDSRGNVLSNGFYAWAREKDESSYYSYRSDDKEINISSERDEYEPGEYIDLTISSKIPDRDVFLSVDRAHSRRYQVVHMDGNYEKISFLLEDTDMPSVTFSVSSFSDDGIDTNYKFIQVSAESKRIDVSVIPDKEKYGPGDFVNLQIKTLDKDENPISAEVSVWAVDKALFELRNSTLKNIFNTFWNKRYSSTAFTHSLKGIMTNDGGKGGCFAAGTEILTEHKKLKNIEDIEIGDTILTRQDIKNDDLVEAKVTDVHEHEVTGYLIINRHLRITPNHKLLVNGKWQEAGDIQKGDYVIGEDDQKITVNSIEWQQGKFTVYNLTIEDQHTFFANGVWVHNQKGGVRSDLKDAAYWNPSVQTDLDGNANVSFKLPDNLTTWVLAGVAATNKTEVGQSLAEIITTKDVIVQPILPYILRVDDRMVVSGLVQNFTDQDRTFDVELLFDAGDVSNPIQEVNIKSKESAQIFWGVLPNQANEEAKFEISAVSKDQDEIGDVLEKSIPVREFGFWETESFAGIGNIEYFAKIPDTTKKDSVSIELSTSLNLVNTVPDNFKYLLSYPYGCMEQTVSRLIPLIINRENPGLFYKYTENIDTEDMIKEGLKRIQAHQKINGGWSWWHGNSAEPGISVYIFEHLIRLEKTGFDVNDSLLNSARQYFINLDNSHISNQVFKNYALTLDDQYDGPKLDLINIEHLSYDASILSMAVMANVRNGYTNANTNGLNKLLDNKIEDRGDVHWDSLTGSYRSSNDATTALAFRAILEADGPMDIADQIILYFSRNRNKHYWSNTYATAVITEALIEYEEKILDRNNSINRYVVTIDGEEFYRGAISNDNKSEQIDIPVDKIKEEGSLIKVQQEDNNSIFHTIIIKGFDSDKNAEAKDNGISIKRKYVNTKGINYSLGVGDIVDVHIELEGLRPEDRYVVVQDYLPAGMIAINESFKDSYSKRNYYGYYYNNYGREITQDGIIISSSYWNNNNKFTYRARVISEGDFIAPPAFATLMYQPDVYGRSAVEYVSIGQVSEKMYDISVIDKILQSVGSNKWGIKSLFSGDIKNALLSAIPFVVIAAVWVVIKKRKILSIKSKKDNK
jgi:uncharacterized protein YfaS (alpha-2-macroglobulin family)